MDARFEYLTNLQYKVKTLAARLALFESGEKYVAMKAESRRQLAELEGTIKRLRLELADAHCQTVTVRKNWLQVIEDLEKEHARSLAEKDRTIKAMEARALKAEHQLEEERRKLREKCSELYQVKSELEEEKGRGSRLMLQLKRDHENSSIPSSMKPNRKKIPNSREKTGRRPGGQPGHKGHGKKKHTPTNLVYIPAPEKYACSPDYKPTGRTITKQVVNLSVSIVVDEYSTPEFINKRTSQRVHADFPEGVVNDVNYGGSIKAFSFLLNSRCCVSIGKVKEFLSDITDGGLQVSTGMICGLTKEFSKKTQAEQKEAFSRLLCSPVMGADFTGGRVNGKGFQIAVCTAPDTVMYFVREHKGHKGVAGTPVEDFRGILVHDHDKTFYKYGSSHQECLAHVLRYLKGSMENEPGLKWNKQMHELIREMIHCRNALDQDADLDAGKAAGFEARYMEILGVAEGEYEYEPPRKYYKDGYNLYRRLLEYKDSHLLFLYDKRVPTNNNLSERMIRILKAKQKQVMTFRSPESLEYLCDSLGMIALLRMQGENLYSSAADIFN